jgi:hypothetical protein
MENKNKFRNTDHSIDDLIKSNYDIDTSKYSIPSLITNNSMEDEFIRSLRESIKSSKINRKNEFKSDKKIIKEKSEKEKLVEYFKSIVNIHKN